MLLPTRLEHIYERYPYATWSLLALNTLVFFGRLAAGADDFGGWALDPRDLNPLQFITSMFLHAGLFHLLGNMLFLWVYGRYVEDRLGPWRYLALYFVTGILGDLLYLAMGQDNPCVGASGAISGLMGFVLVIAPWNDVRVIWLIHPAQFAAQGFDGRFKIAAFWLLGIWLLFQLLLAGGGGSGIAVMAHLGGFFGGAGLAALFRSHACKGTPWYVEPAPPGGGKAARRRLHAARKRGPSRRKAGRLTPVVVLESLSAEASGVSVVKLLMKRLLLTPEDAKEHVDALRGGSEQRFEFDEAEQAARFHSEVLSLGATARIEGPAIPEAAVGATQAEPKKRDLDLPPLEF